MEERTGKFITLEGIEGSGKSTQQKRLANWLTEQSLEVVATKEPGGTAIGQHIRGILLHSDHDHMAPACEAMLYLADRAQHHEEIIKPALERGAWIICDRYHDSTLAYQGAARGIGKHYLDPMFNAATGGLQPHLTILLDMLPERGLARARARNSAENLEQIEGRFEAEALHFHQQVRASFLKMAEQEPQRYVIIDADQDPELVALAIRRIITKRWMASHV